MDACHGTIAVDSSRGGGTTFTVEPSLGGTPTNEGKWAERIENRRRQLAELQARARGGGDALLGGGGGGSIDVMDGGLIDYQAAVVGFAVAFLLAVLAMVPPPGGTKVRVAPFWKLAPLMVRL